MLPEKSRRPFARLINLLSATCFLCGQTPSLAASTQVSAQTDPYLLADSNMVWHWLKPNEYMPTSEIKPGMEGYGLSVFLGTKVERFNVKVIGVVKKVINGRDAIMVRLSGPMIGKNNVIRGMSGSPVYINGRLIGAVSYGFDFSSEPIAGITPIADMLDALGPQESPHNTEPYRVSHLRPSTLSPNATQSIATASGGIVRVAGGAPHLVPLMAPVSLAGFSPRAEQFLAESLKERGMWVSSGSGGAMDSSLAPSKKTVQPGGAVSVMLTTGDFNSSACGTATATFGKHVLAFGHPFMQAGFVDFPMANAYVHQILPCLSVSFKVASPTNIIGSFVSDRPWAVSGEIGRSAKLIPATYTVTDETRQIKRVFHCSVIDHPDLTPELVAATAMSAIDATHQSAEPYVMQVKSNIDTVRLGTIERQDRYSGNFALPKGGLRQKFFTGDSVANFLMSTTTKIINNDFEKASIKSVNVDISLEDGHNTAKIERVYLDKPFVAPGESFDVHCILRPYNGKAFTKTLTLKVPRDVPDGNMLVGVAAGDDIDAVRRRIGLTDPTPENLDDVVKKIRDAGSGDNITAVLALPEQSILVGGTILPNPPAQWAKLFFSDRFTRGPQLVRAEQRVTLPVDQLVDGNHIITIEVRRPDKDQARSQPYFPTAAGSVSSLDGSYVTDAARKAIDGMHKTDTKDATSLADKPANFWTPSKDGPHMRSLLMWSQETYNDFSSGKTDATTVDSWGRISPAFKDVAQKDVESEMRIWSSAWANGYFWFASNDKVWRWKGDDSAPQPVAQIKGVALPAMTVDKAGNLYVASVPSGQIYRIDGSKEPEQAAQLVAKVAEPIITSLCCDDKNNLYAGVASTGKVYKFEPDNSGWARTASVFFDSGQASVTCLFYCNHDGKIYVGTAEKGAVFSVDASGTSKAEYQSPDHIVTGAVRDNVGDLYVATAGQGHLVKVAPTGAVSTLATSEAFYTLLYDRTTNGVFSGDGEGDITQAQVDPLSNQSYFVPVCHTEQDAVLALACDGNGHMFAGTSNLAVARTFDMKQASHAAYTSIVRDGGRDARWSRLRVYGAYNEVSDDMAKALQIETRTGETSTPDATWSAWEPAKFNNESFSIASPAGRFMQYRVSWNQLKPNAKAVTVGKIETTYQPSNQAPEFTTISLKTGTACSGKQEINVTANDPDGDNLAMTVEVSSDGAKTWIPVVADLRSHHGSAAAKGVHKASAPDSGSSDTKNSDAPTSSDSEAGKNNDSSTSKDQSGKSQTLGYSSPKREQLDDEDRPGNGDDKSKDADKDKDSKDENKDDQKDTDTASKSTDSSDKKSFASAPVSSMTPSSGEKFTYRWDTSKLKDGNYLVKFCLNDRPSNPAGHLQTVALRTVELENSVPKIDSVNLRKGSDRTAVLTVKAHDQHTPIVNATYKFDDGEPFALGNPDNITDGLDADFEVTDIAIPHGSHKLEVQITNKAGNTASKTITL